MPQQATDQYTTLRDELQRLQAQPFPDQKAVDAVIDALEQLQRAIKATRGPIGNNPLE